LYEQNLIITYECDQRCTGKSISTSALR